MKIKHHEILPNNQNPFADCKLDREPYAKILTDVVSNYADGFVLAINNDWGAGKTTFIKMWQQYLHLEKNGFKTVYFNAWENDFNSNPLIPFMAEFNTLIQSDDDKLFKSVIQKGSVLIKNVIPAVARAITKNYIDTDSLVDAVENSTKAAVEILEVEIKEYANKKKAIVEFRNELEKFVKFEDSNKPLVFFIDELDRCRPNYAVEVLEQIKHFFAVPGIVFVLSIDKNHLASAIRGVYGSEQINTDEYLRRFIDLEYSIPQPSNESYCKYLYEYFEFDDFFKSDERRKHNVFQNDSDLFIKTAYLLLKKSNTTLRQLEKIFGQTRLILKSFQPNQYVFSNLLFILIFLKIKNQKLYNNIENNKLTLQELSDAYADLMPSKNRSFYDVNLVFVEALLLHFYNNNQEYENRIELFEIDSNGLVLTHIKSKTEELVNKERFKLANSLQNIENQQWDFHDLNLQYLLNKINLTEPIYIN